ncbi:MAG: HPr(Ser) kinase/phosphatase [Lachnospiraceae bacterium]|nr:HPr(Ser) kinase/phosphatase [Lachnospiraceae bacterium]
MAAKPVALTELIEKMNLSNLTPEIDVGEKQIPVPEINRPALQLTGFFEHFDKSRMEIIGLVEYTYMQQMDEDKKEGIYDKLLSPQVPAVIFCRNLEPDPIFYATAMKNGVPILKAEKHTSNVMAEIIRWLNVKLAPCISIHGVLVDVNGQGILLTGESGIGKSEAALELIKRGHRLISDDVVEIRRVSDDTLIGSAPNITKHFIELRGIGIIDVKALYGTTCVKETMSIDLVIHFEDWDRDKEYDRIGLTEEYTEYLGKKVVCHNIPIRPGRNLAIIVETAAINYRQKQMGYNAAQELYHRVQQNMKE